jgi:hypothetical protein
VVSTPVANSPAPVASEEPMDASGLPAEAPEVAPIRDGLSDAQASEPDPGTSELVASSTSEPESAWSAEHDREEPEEASVDIAEAPVSGQSLPGSPVPAAVVETSSTSEAPEAVQQELAVSTPSEEARGPPEDPQPEASAAQPEAEPEVATQASLDAFPAQAPSTTDPEPPVASDT